MRICSRGRRVRLGVRREQSDLREVKIAPKGGDRAIVLSEVGEDGERGGD
jgi:hypothetical protein